MSLSAVLAIIGGICGLAGSAITAIGANKTIMSLRLASSAHDLTIKQIAERQGVVIFEGLGKQQEKAWKHDTRLVISGIVLLAIAFVLQALGILFTK
jgi:hypothetical protein